MKRILVVGDLMLDVSLVGKSFRASPEAPGAPVMRAERQTTAPGGAANVAANIATMGGTAALLGAIGQDGAADILKRFFAENGALLKAIVRDRPTTAKTRIYCNDRMHIRLDVEAVAPLTDAEAARLVAEGEAILEDAGALVLSDYAKGVITPDLASGLIAAARARRIPVVVDSKTPLARHFFGATVVKFNLPEASVALDRHVGLSATERAAAAMSIWKRGGADHVILTAGDLGLALASAAGVRHIPGHEVEAVDVTGAGDAVAAALALSLAAGDAIEDAARFANAAGAIVVTKRGTAGPAMAEVAALCGREPGAVDLGPTHANPLVDFGLLEAELASIF